MLTTPDSTTPHTLPRRSHAPRPALHGRSSPSRPIPSSKRDRPSASETWRQSPQSNLRCRRRGVVRWTGRMYLRVTSTSPPACVKHRRAPRPVEARRLYRGRPRQADLRHSSHSCPPRSVSHATGDAARSRAVELPDSTRSACRTLRNQGDNPSLARCESLVLTVLTIVVRRNPTQIRYTM